VEIPRSKRAPKREFKLPDEISKPIPRRAAPEQSSTEDESAEDSSPPKRRRRNSTGRFKERTLGWFKTGEELEGKDAVDPEETGESIPESRSNLAVAVIVGGVGVAAVVAVILWLS
jgi:hypothetical protein